MCILSFKQINISSVDVFIVQRVVVFIPRCVDVFILQGVVVFIPHGKDVFILQSVELFTPQCVYVFILQRRSVNNIPQVENTLLLDVLVAGITRDVILKTMDLQWTNMKRSMPN